VLESIRSMPAGPDERGAISIAVNWVRTVNANLSWAAGSAKMASIPSGNTLLRVRFGWGFAGTSAATASLVNIAGNVQIFGLVTLPSTDEATVPNPRTEPYDPDPPLSRWLWWEGRAPVAHTLNATEDIVTWTDSRLQEPADGKGQVAGNVPAGDTLDLWATWAPAAAWDASGTAYLWYWASIAYKTTT